MNYKHRSSAPWEGLSFNSKGICLCLILILIAFVLECPNNVEAKSLHHAKKPLKFLQSPSSLIQLRHKRDTFTNEERQQPHNENNDDNYDVIPDAGTQPPNLDDQITERAKQIAQSFTDMWQSLTNSIRHCISALRALFGAEGEELTPEQEEQLRVAMEEEYRYEQEHDNEVFVNKL